MIYDKEYLKRNPRKANNHKLISYDLKIEKYKEFCSDKNSTFKSTKEYINYKNWQKKTDEISWIFYRNPEKVYLKDKI